MRIKNARNSKPIQVRINSNHQHETIKSSISKEFFIVPGDTVYIKLINCLTRYRHSATDPQGNRPPRMGRWKNPTDPNPIITIHVTAKINDNKENPNDNITVEDDEDKKNKRKK